MWFAVLGVKRVAFLLAQTWLILSELGGVSFTRSSVLSSIYDLSSLVK